MGNFINNLLDNLLSTLWRVLDLPMYFIFILLIIILLCSSFVLKKIFKGLTKKKLLLINGVILFFFLILIVDKKFRQLNTEVNSLNDKISTLQFNSVTTAPIVKTNFVYDIDNLKTEFPTANVYENPIHQAIDVISYKTTSPNVVAYVAVIDLMYPGVEIKVTPEKKEKYLTSTFAKETGCLIAINGEAGESMAMDCLLGEWSGNWVSDGNPIMLVDTDKRPFIGFEKNSTAHYSTESEVDTILNDEKYNTIWGRFDILVDDQVITHEGDNPYARTVMGSDSLGKVLYLMIVDGKRPDYSEGLTYENCAKILRSLGASNAMACDQGGSSCMYVEPMGGIINRPADSDGMERPIYSHFGIKVK